MLSRLALSIALSWCAAAPVAADCDRAEEYFKKGLEAGQNANWTDAKDYLEQSVGVCDRFDNWYLLGQANQQLEEYQAAAAAFEDARHYASDNDEIALAAARYAEVLAQQGWIDEPLAILHQARKRHSNAPAWMTELAIALDKKQMGQPLSVEQVTRALNSRAVKLLHPDATPAVNIRINFETNSTDVTPSSAQNLDILAQALADDKMSTGNILIAGHSDVRGDAAYNQALSERRAQEVAAAIVNRQPKLNGRLKTSGAGEKAPLYAGDSAEEHALNRRIEVFIE